MVYRGYKLHSIDTASDFSTSPMEIGTLSNIFMVR